MTNPDFHESDRVGEMSPNDPDPGAQKPDADTADTIGVPVGSAPQEGGSDFADGAETSSEVEEDGQGTGNPIIPASAFNETNTEG